MTNPSSIDERDAGLAAQYEAYPYPERNPQDETRRLLIGSPSHLREIEYWVFGAQRPRTQALRVLIAGCGTGDAAIMLATQLARGTRQAEVVCVDRSTKALSIAQARAQTRKLENIRFVQGSLTELESLELGLFDYIDCCGVLHHLPDPVAALQTLERHLAPMGGMGLMVYAPYGRTGVYMLQDALEKLAPITQSPEARLDTASRIMRTLPATAWLRQNGNFGDHLSGGDAGLYDLLLNPRDRSYTITDFLTLLDQAGLEPTALMEPARYDPALFLPDPRLRAHITPLPWQTQAAIAEDLTGNMATHVAYAVRKNAKPRKPNPLDPNAVPIMREIPGAELAKQMTPDNMLPFHFGTLVVPVPLPPQARGILPLIDGERTVGELADILAARGVNASKFNHVWRESFDILERLNRVLLRAPA